MKGILVVFGVLVCSVVLGQDIQQPKNFHQIFLKDTVEILNFIKYDNDSLPAIEYELSPDKTAIYLYNYDGLSRLTLNYRSTTQATQSINKNKCSIHHLPES